MVTQGRFEESRHPRGGDPANRGRFSPAPPADFQAGGLTEPDRVSLDPYGRENFCRWNEWYWTVRPATETFRDGLSDDDYNRAHVAGSPPVPRNPSQIAGFWRGFDQVPDDTEEVYRLRSRLAERDTFLARDFYMWESGFGPEDLPRGVFTSGLSDRQIRKYKAQCEEWARTIPNPLHSETGAGLYVALQAYTDARCLDARNGKNPDDPDSAASEIGMYWQTETGRTPKDVIETCRLVHVMDMVCRPFPGREGYWRWMRKDHRPWTGGRTYVKPFNPWRGIKAQELFDGATSGREPR